MGTGMRQVSAALWLFLSVMAPLCAQKVQMTIRTISPQKKFRSFDLKCRFYFRKKSPPYSVFFRSDRPAGVRGAAAVGKRCRGRGEHLQDPLDHLHPQRKPSGFRGGKKGVIQRRGAEVHCNEAVHR